MRHSYHQANQPLFSRIVFNPEQTRSLIQPGIVVATLCLFLRLWDLYQISGSAFFAFPDGDPRYYLDWARRISGGTWTDGQAFFGLPLYPYWLALLFTIFGHNLFIPLAIQAVADAVLAGLITNLSYFILAKHGPGNLVDESVPATRRPNLAWWTSAGAGSAWAFYQPAQAYAVTLMPTTLAVLCFWAVVRWVVRLEARPSPWTMAGAGIGLGVIATLVANILFLIPLIVSRLFFIGTTTARRGVGIAAATLILIALSYGHDVHRAIGRQRSSRLRSPRMLGFAA